jgi:nitroreductase
VDTYLAVASKRDWRSYADRPIPEDVVTRILDGGRLAGNASNKQPWTFVLVEDPERKERLAESVYVAANVRSAALVIAIATPGAGNLLDVGRAMQNMMLVAWNDGVVSCPNGMPDRGQTAQALGLEGDLLPATVLTFGYPRRPLDPESRSAEEWSREANRKPLDEILKRL